MSAVQTNPREEELLQSVRGALEAKNYADHPIIYKGSVSSTHSLRELLIASSVDMETTNTTNVTALCTLESDPPETIECFERLLRFTEEGGGGQRAELSLVLFPVFTHLYLDFVSSGHSDIAQNFFNKFFSMMSPTHQGEMNELSEIVTAEQLSNSQLAGRFRTQKYCLRMSNQAFQLLMEFLQACSVPVLLNLIQRHLAIEVYGSTPQVNGEHKADQKKASQAPTFIKPKIPHFHTSPNSQRKKKSLPSFSGVAPQGVPMATSDSVLEGVGGKQKQLQRQPSLLTSHLTEFREKLAMASQFDPCPPSVALYSIQSGPLGIHCACLSATSKNFCCGFADSSIHLWSQLPKTAGHMTNHMTDHMTLSNQPIRLQNSTSGHHLLLGHCGSVYGTCFNSTGQYMLSCSEDSTVRLWDAHKHCSLVCYRGHAYPVWDVSFSPVDVYFASASFDKTARLWATDLVYPLRIFAGHTAGVDVVRFHPNGKYVATGSSDHTCRLWDIQNGHCVRLMTGSKGAVSCIAFSLNGKQMVTGGEDHVIRLWDLGSGAVVQEFHGHSNNITALTYSPDGTLLASSCHGNQIRVWNMRSASLPPPGTTASGSQDADTIAVHPTPATLVLSLQFTHRNCLVAIGTSPTHTQS